MSHLDILVKVNEVNDLVEIPSQQFLKGEEPTLNRGERLITLKELMLLNLNGYLRIIKEIAQKETAGV